MSDAEFVRGNAYYMRKIRYEKDWECLAYLYYDWSRFIQDELGGDSTEEGRIANDLLDDWLADEDDDVGVFFAELYNEEA
jgi:hypothetical protein